MSLGNREKRPKAKKKKKQVYELLSTERFRLALTTWTLDPAALISGDEVRGISDRRLRMPRLDSRGYSHLRCLRAH